MKARALLYHDVVESGNPDESGFASPDANIYKLDIDLFREHLDALHEHVGTRVGLLGAPSEPQDREPVLLTFDDGGSSAYGRIAGELECRGFRGYFFITTDFIGQPGFLARHEIRELSRRGHIVGSHSASHPAMISRCTDEELDHEWQRSVMDLRDILGEAPTTASVPGGFYTRRVARAAERAGVRQLFTSEPTPHAWQVGRCLVLGRHTIQVWTPAERAVALAVGDPAVCAAQWLAWNTKKAAKVLGGPMYVWARRVIFSERNKRRAAASAASLGELVMEVSSATPLVGVM